MSELGVNEIKTALTAVPGSLGNRKIGIIDAARAVGSIRPAALPKDLEERKQHLTVKREYFQAITENEARKKGKEYNPTPENLYIEASDREIAERLEPDYFTVVRLLVSGEFRKYIERGKAARVVVQRWSNQAFPDSQDLPNLVFTDSDGNAMPTHLIQDIFDKYPTVKERREVFYKAVAKDPEYEDLRKQVYDKEIQRLQPDEYRALAAESIHNLLNKRKEREKRGVMGKLSVSYGLEVEVGAIEGATHRKILDSMQELGVPVMYENGRIRELPLPPSLTKDQIKVLVELQKIGLITNEQQLALHINVGEAGRVIDEDTFLLDAIIWSADLVGLSSRMKGSEGIVKFPEIGRKPLFPDRLDILGLTFLQRSDQSTLELRHGFMVTMDHFVSAAKDMVSIACLAESLCAYRRIAGKPVSEVTEKDSQLAAAWTELKDEVTRNLTEAQLPKYTKFTENYKKSGNNMRSLESECGGAQAEIARKVYNDKTFSEQQRLLILKLRSRVRDALAS